MHTTTTEIEIASSPEHVREVLMDFAKMPEWHQGHFKYIKGKSPVEPGDKLEVAVEVQGVPPFTPTVLENNAREFKWVGGFSPIFTGTHSFRFEQSRKTPGSTTFIHTEEFTGMFGHTMHTKRKSGAENLAGFEKFNQDIKARAERQQ